MRTRKPEQNDIFYSPTQDDGRGLWIDECFKIEYDLSQVKNPYVGNKRKIIGRFGEILWDEGYAPQISEGCKVLDLFSGSGFVSYMFKRLGASVWGNDILASSYINTKSLIESQLKCNLNNINNVLYSTVNSYLNNIDSSASESVFDVFVPERFSERESACLQIIRDNITKSSPTFYDPSKLDEYAKVNDIRIKYLGQKVDNIDKEYNPYINADKAVSIILQYILSNCFVGGRLNKGQILAQYDHRVSHNKNSGCEMSFSIEDMHLYDISHNSMSTCRATRSDAFDILLHDSPIVKNTLDSIDIVYIDPPYGGQQSDYSYMYNFMEHFIYQGDPPDRSDKFVQSKKYKDHFADLLDCLPLNADWIFSYNDDSWADIDTIEKMLIDKRRSPKIISCEYNYKYRKNQSAGVEYIIIAKRK